jgi:hypothetical protein
VFGRSQRFHLYSFPDGRAVVAAALYSSYLWLVLHYEYFQSKNELFECHVWYFSELFCALPRVHAPFWRAGLSCSHHQLSYCQLDEHNGRLYCVKQAEHKSSTAKHGIELAFSSLETVQPDWIEVQCSPPSEFSVDAKGSRLRYLTHTSVCFIMQYIYIFFFLTEFTLISPRRARMC